MAAAAKKKPAKPRTSPGKTHEVVLQSWEVADSWSGPEDTVPTLHLTQEDCDLYVRGYYRTHNNLPSAPESYTRTSRDPKMVNVTSEWYKKLRARRRSKKTDYTKYGIEAGGLKSYLR